MTNDLVNVSLRSDYYVLAGLLLLVTLVACWLSARTTIRGRPTAAQAAVALGMTAAGVTGIAACLAQLADPLSPDDLAFPVTMGALLLTGGAAVLTALTRLLTTES